VKTARNYFTKKRSFFDNLQSMKVFRSFGKEKLILLSRKIHAKGKAYSLYGYSLPGLLRSAPPSAAGPHSSLLLFGMPETSRTASIVFYSLSSIAELFMCRKYFQPFVRKFTRWPQLVTFNSSLFTVPGLHKTSPPVSGRRSISK
jgi:membrane protease YdiL (CAAX protease family)